MARLTYRYRLYPTEEQKAIIEQHFDATRMLYNLMLEDRTAHFRSTHQWKKIDTAPFIEKNKWMKDLDQAALQQVENNLATAYRYFLNVPRQELRYRPEAQYRAKLDPSYRLMDTDLEFYPQQKYKSTKESYATRRENVVLTNKKVFLPAVGNVRYVKHRPLPEDSEILYYVILKKPAGTYYLLVQLQVPDSPAAEVPPKTIIGVALSPGCLAVRSDEQPVVFHHQTEQQEKRMEKAYRDLKRQKPGSKRYEKQRQYLASLFEHRAMQRRDDLYKAAKEILDQADGVMMETPNVKKRQAALERRGEDKIVKDEAWWLFSKLMQQKAEQRGKTFFRVPPLFPLYTRCSRCGTLSKDGAQEKEWCCPRCKEQLPLALNAAKNLQQLGENYNMDLNRL